MLKRHSVLAALVAAVLSVATAKVAAAQQTCEEICASLYGYVFYAPTYFYDDVGNLGSPGFYQLVDCDDDWCYYYGGGQVE